MFPSMATWDTAVVVGPSVSCRAGEAGFAPSGRAGGRPRRASPAAGARVPRSPRVAVGRRWGPSLLGHGKKGRICPTLVCSWGRG